MLLVPVEKFLLGASRGLDFTYGGLLEHHQRVAYLSLALGQAAGLSRDQLNTLFKTAIIHDAGIASFAEKETLAQFEMQTEARWRHCQRGFEFASGIEALDDCARKVLFHHDRWSGGNPSGYEKSRIPLIGRIIHLTDRITVLIGDETPILQQVPAIKEQILNESGREFDPDLVNLLFTLLNKESLWLDLTAPWLEQRLLAGLEAINALHKASLVDLSRLFARVVDAKSHFTFCHSRGVAMCARLLGEELGFSAKDCSLLGAGGLLHDLGKITIPDHILQKKGRLTVAEYDIVKQHPYYTYWLLKPAAEDLPLAEWAAFHHERLDGSGYPFGKTGAEIPLGSRIMAVADIFTALREDRPYRSSMSWFRIERILEQKVKSGTVDEELVDIVFTNRSRLDAGWQQIKECPDSQG
jgi:HD-GYP domain-containing protein (c-di-GMP phosphodiesterase class II)